MNRRRPNDGWDRQSNRPPELVAEHRHAVAGVLVMLGMGIVVHLRMCLVLHLPVVVVIHMRVAGVGHDGVASASVYRSTTSLPARISHSRQREYTTGRTISVSAALVINPPTIGAAIRLSTSEPVC